MERTDFIENRTDVIKNIYTLYSYLRSNSEEERDWALNRFKLGKWYIVEPFGNMLFFAPSRFVGYKNNNIAKHTENHGYGTQTNEYFRRNKLYKISENEFLSKQFKNFMLSIGIKKNLLSFLSLIIKTYQICNLTTNVISFVLPIAVDRKRMHGKVFLRKESWR